MIKGEAVKICGFGGMEWLLRYKKIKGKGGGPACLGFRRRRLGEKNSNQPGGAAVCKEIGLGLGFVFFVFF